MPSTQVEFQALMERVFSGSEEAVQELLKSYGPLLHRAVRRNLHRKLRPKFDSLDFVQDVWASFFTQLPGENTFQNPETLVAFLTRLARNKVAETTRQRMQRQKYNVNRERSLNSSSFGAEEQLAASQPTPSEIAMGHEAWDQLLKTQPLVYRRILILVREGNTPVKIAQEMGISERTVRRVIEKALPGVAL